MITHIDGILEEKNPVYVIIDVNGIGYLLYITLNTYSEVPEKGRVRLLTQFVVREDAQLLYGFFTGFSSSKKIYKKSTLIVKNWLLQFCLTTLNCSRKSRE